MEGDDDRTQHMDVADEAATQRFDDSDDRTRRMPRTDDETQVLGASHEHERTATQHLSPVTAPASQRTERIRVAAGRAPLGPWLIATLVVIGLIVGGLLGYLQTQPSDDNVVARALVGADGGVLTFDGVGRLEVPRDALPTATAITVRKESLDRRVRLGGAEDPRSRVYEQGELDVYAFEPADLRFQQPVRITLPRVGDAEAVLVDSEQGARVIPAEASGNTVTLETTSFAFDQ
jgi:hypothetical protein